MTALTAMLSGGGYKATAQDINSEYNRNSLTIISVKHRDSYDSVTETYLKFANPGGDKFDVTRIPTTTAASSSARLAINHNGETSQNTQVTRYMNGLSSYIEKSLSDNTVGKQLVEAWFNRSKSGRMDVSTINRRAEYNATDETFNVANSQALGKYLLQSGGSKLIAHSYVLVVDHSRPEISYQRNKSGAISSVTASTEAMGYLYRLDFGDMEQQKVFDCWIYPDDDAKTKDSKLAAWEQLNFRLVAAGSTSTSCSASENISSNKKVDENALVKAAIEKCATMLIAKFEKNVHDWQVKSGIYTTYPLGVKIGMKEGLSRMDRYEVLEYVLDENGNTSPRRKGWIRATQVNDNRISSQGKTALSEFYQIAGGHLEPGMQIHQKKSLNFDIKALYYAGCGKGFGLEFDYAFGMKTKMGMVHHIRLSGVYAAYKKGFTANDEYELNQALDFVDIRMGYGYGIRPFHQLELIPAVNILANSYIDAESSNPGQEESTLSFLMKTGWAVEAGLEANVTIWYPVKFNAGIFYDQYLFGGVIWKQAMDVLDHLGTSRSGVNMRFGLVYEF